MSIHFRNEVEKLHKMLLALGALVEDNPVSYTHLTLPTIYSV